MINVLPQRSSTHHVPNSERPSSSEFSMERLSGGRGGIFEPSVAPSMGSMRVLLWPHARIATGAARRWNDGRPSATRRRRHELPIHRVRRADDAIRPRQLVARISTCLAARLRLRAIRRIDVRRASLLVGRCLRRRRRPILRARHGNDQNRDGQRRHDSGREQWVSHVSLRFHPEGTTAGAEGCSARA